MIFCHCWLGSAGMGQGNRPGRAGMAFKMLTNIKRCKVNVNVVSPRIISYRILGDTLKWCAENQKKVNSKKVNCFVLDS